MGGEIDGKFTINCKNWKLGENNLCVTTDCRKKCLWREGEEVVVEHVQDSVPGKKMDGGVVQR